MIPPTGDCPDPARLQRTLDEALSDTEWGAVAAHLETCTVCRAQLDQWTQDPTAPAGARRTHAFFDVPTGPSLKDVLERLNRHPGLAVTAERPTEGSGACPGEILESSPSQSGETTTAGADDVALGFL